jgi:DNA-binding Lrp family transcriptional regulator
MRNLDAIDLQLLGLLQTDVQRTADDLAGVVHLSPSAVARRLRRLRASGVIASEVAILDLAAGPFLSAVVEVKVERHAMGAYDPLIRRLEAHPNVQLLMDVSGPFDFMLLVVTSDMDAFNAFADSELAGDPGVQRYETRFVKRRRKFSTALPLAQAWG